MEAKNIYQKSNLGGWNFDTTLCCNLKTILRGNRRMRPGTECVGILRRDVSGEDFGCDSDHFTFTEATIPSTTERRNVHLFEGRHITCTKRLNGSVRLNFKNLKVDAEFNVDGYAIEVANEIREALTGLVESE